MNIKKILPNPSAVNLNILPSTLTATKSRSMAKGSLQSHIGKQIIIYNSILIVTVILFFAFRGFDREEFTTLMGLLGPITAVYIGTLFRHLGNSLQGTAVPEKGEKVGITSYGTLIQWIIPLHFFLIFGLITAKAAFNLISFDDMMLIFTFVETSFGGYVGYVISSIFQVELEKK